MNEWIHNFMYILYCLLSNRYTEHNTVEEIFFAKPYLLNQVNAELWYYIR